MANIGQMERLSDIRFNALFLLALNAYAQKLRPLSTGSNGRHPLLRLVLLRACRQDIKEDGLEAAQKKWQHFIASPQVKIQAGKKQNE